MIKQLTPLKTWMGPNKFHQRDFIHSTLISMMVESLFLMHIVIQNKTSYKKIWVNGNILSLHFKVGD